MGDHMFVIWFLVAYYVGIIHGSRSFKAKQPPPTKYHWSCQAPDCGVKYETNNFEAMRQIVLTHCRAHLNETKARRACICTENAFINNLPHEPNCPMSKQEH